MKDYKKLPSPEDTNEDSVLKRLTEIRDALLSKFPKDDPYYDSAEMKRILHVSDSTLYRMRKNKDIPFKKIRGGYYYPKAYVNNAFKS